MGRVYERTAFASPKRERVGGVKCDMISFFAEKQHMKLTHPKCGGSLHTEYTKRYILQPKIDNSVNECDYNLHHDVFHGERTDCKIGQGNEGECVNVLLAAHLLKRSRSSVGVCYKGCSVNVHAPGHVGCSGVVDLVDDEES